MCLFLTRYFDERLKIKRLSKVNRKPRVLNFSMLHNATASENKFVENSQLPISSNDFRAVLFRYYILHKIDNFPDKILAQSIPSMPIPATPSPAPGICRVFVILFWRSCKCPTMGLKNEVQLPHPGTTPKLYFQQISCNFHIYGKSVII